MPAPPPLPLNFRGPATRELAENRPNSAAGRVGCKVKFEALPARHTKPGRLSLAFPLSVVTRFPAAPRPLTALVCA